MSKELRVLMGILDLSVNRYGEDKPLTLGHLRNIVGCAINRQRSDSEAHERFMNSLSQETYLESLMERD
jgi:hypothetical protein